MIKKLTSVTAATTKVFECVYEFCHLLPTNKHFHQAFPRNYLLLPTTMVNSFSVSVTPEPQVSVAPLCRVCLSQTKT